MTLPRGDASLKHRSQSLDDMTEDELLQGLLDACYVGGWLVHHVRRSDMGLQQGHAGFPDIVAVHPGRREFIAWECKTARGTATLLQDEWLDALQDALDWRNPRHTLPDGLAMVALVRPKHYDAAVLYLIGDKLLAKR